MNAEPLTGLVVDDDNHVAEVHAGFVERVPAFRVVGQAHTAAEAIRSAETLEPDLVLLDIYLPDGDGFDVARALLARPQPPAVLVISAARDVASVRLATHVGALHYLVQALRIRRPGRASGRHPARTRPDLPDTRPSHPGPGHTDLRATPPAPT